MDELENLASEYKASLYEYHKTKVEMLIVELELASSILCWLDRQQISFPSAADKLYSLTEKLVEQIDRIEEEIESNFDSMLEVSGLLA